MRHDHEIVPLLPLRDKTVAKHRKPEMSATATDS